MDTYLFATRGRLIPITTRGTPPMSMPAPINKNVRLLMDNPMTPKVTAHTSSGNAAVMYPFIMMCSNARMKGGTIASGRPEFACISATANDGEAA